MAHKFKGYYFRHLGDGHTLALIPGASEDGAFIQVLSDQGVRQFDFPGSAATFGDTVRIGDNTFGSEGVHLCLPGIVGDIRYNGLTPIRSDIMGPFRRLPMECRHEIVSMRHTLSGCVDVEGITYGFDGGVGYWEGDSGRSFPSDYLWIQANDFPGGESFVLSIAHIPFGILHFRGVICVLMTGGREYRLATYLGAQASVGDRQFTVRQGDLWLEGDIRPATGGSPLAAPRDGHMRGIIREDNRAVLHIILHQGQSQICDLSSGRAGYERYPDL